MSDPPTFEFHVSADADLGDQLLVGFSSPAMASLIAIDHLATVGETTKVGHVTADNVPTITPFEAGVPRHPIRLYTMEDGPSVLVCELFVPLEIGDGLADAIVDLTAEHGIEEVTALYGVPYAHGPEEHTVFSVATEDYDRSRLERVDIEPLKGGYLDGLPGTLLQAGLASESLSVGTLVTPAHPPGPDFEGALRLLDAVEHHYEVVVDMAPLEAQSEEIRLHYEELASRIETESEQRERPEDRMYM